MAYDNGLSVQSPGGVMWRSREMNNKDIQCPARDLNPGHPES
jgi:hypothetical protein